MTYEVEVYSDEKGNSPFEEWLESIAAGDGRRIRKRLLRIEDGNLGDHKAVGGGFLNSAASLGQVIGSILDSTEQQWCCCC